MQKVKLRWLSLLVLLFMFVVAGCNSSSTGSAISEKDPESKDKSTVGQAKSEEGAPKKGGEAVLTYVADISSYDPILSSGGGDQPLLWPVYETLITFTPDMELKPGLAESWEISDDKTIILHLREGVTFHDGTTFDAEAVKFNLDRINSEDSAISDLESIESVEVVDSKTVKLLLKKPDASIFATLSDRGGMMVSPTAVQKDGEDYAQNPVGAGPYKLVSRIPNGEIIFEPFDDYWQEGQPYLDKMTIKIMAEENTRINALKSGEVDFIDYITAASVTNIKNDPNLVVKEILPLANRHIFLNTSMAPIDNKAVRLAIQHGINRDEIIQALNFGEGEPAYSLFSQNYWAADKDMKIDYDPEKSKQLLKEAGLKDVSFTMIAHGDAFATRLAEVLKSQLQEVGIEVKIDPMEIVASDASYFAEKKAPAYLAMYTGRGDPHPAVKLLYAEDSFHNAGSYSNPKMEKLISDGISSYDQDERAELYKEINQLAILEEAISIPLYFEPRVTASKNKLKGFEPNLLGKPIFSTLWIEE